MRKMLFAAVAGAALAAASTAALAQVSSDPSTVGELTVTGRWPGESPQTLSAVVSYADLDLRLSRDQAELRHRVDVTAEDLCRRLGEGGPQPPTVGGTCRQNAVRGAMDQVRTAIAQAMTGPAYAEAAPPPEPYVAPATAPSASDDSYAANTAAVEPSYTVQTVTNGPVPDTPANRARYGQPMSRAGKATTPAGN